MNGQQMRMDERGTVLGPQFDKIDKRWGWEQVLVETEHYAVKHLLMRRDQSCSLHWHDRKHETVTCLSGVLAIEFENHPAVTLFPGYSLAIPAGRAHAHRMLAKGESDCCYLEASAAGCRDDATRVTADTPIAAKTALTFGDEPSPDPNEGGRHYHREDPGVVLD